MQLRAMLVVFIFECLAPACLSASLFVCLSVSLLPCVPLACLYAYMSVIAVSKCLQRPKAKPRQEAYSQELSQNRINRQRANTQRARHAVMQAGRQKSKRTLKCMLFRSEAASKQWGKVEIEIAFVCLPPCLSHSLAACLPVCSNMLLFQPPNLHPTC